MPAFNSFDFEHNGRSYTADIIADEDHGAPWEEEDGHGPVRLARSRDDKRPGERPLFQRMRDGGAVYLYDWQEAMAIAKRDGWGLCPADVAKMAADLGREPNRGEIRAEAVRRDFEHLRGWLNDDWSYVGVVVRRAGACRCCGASESLWGIESNADDYLQEVAQQLADQLEAEAAAGRQPMHPADALRLSRAAIPPLEG